jgi:hypothetical protein
MIKRSALGPRWAEIVTITLASDAAHPRTVDLTGVRQLSADARRARGDSGWVDDAGTDSPVPADFDPRFTDPAGAQGASAGSDED